MSGLLMGYGFYVDLPAVPKLILLAALDHADDDGCGIYAGVARYAAKAGCSERTVQRHLAALVEAGYLQVVTEGGGRWRTTEYRASVPMLRAAYDQYGKPRQAVTVTGSNGDSPTTQTVTGDDRNGDRAVSPEPPYNHPEPTDHLTTFGDQADHNDNEHDRMSEPRRRDLLWEAFVAVHGQPATASERGKFNAVVKKLRDADPPVTADEYPILVQAFVARYGGTQPAAATVSERIGELRHFVARGPLVAPSLDDLEQRRRRQQIIASTPTSLPGGVA